MDLIELKANRFVRVRQDFGSAIPEAIELKPKTRSKQRKSAGASSANRNHIQMELEMDFHELGAVE
jgi:hypothetical protein